MFVLSVLGVVAGKKPSNVVFDVATNRVRLQTQSYTPNNTWRFVAIKERKITTSEKR